MARVNVYIPDDLHEQMRAATPRRPWSQIVQDAVRQELEEIESRRLEEPMDRQAMLDAMVEDAERRQRNRVT